MPVQEDMPHPDNCKWCQEARNCPTSSFDSRILLDPLPQSNQSMTDYLNNLCECGHQMVPSFSPDGKDIPSRLGHTKLCKEHTIRWMEKIITLKMEFNPEEYNQSLS